MAKRERMGSAQFISYQVEVEAALHKGYERNLQNAVLIWHNSLVKTMSGRRSGEEYLVPGTKVYYRASAPGEPPAPRTGTLRASYYTEVSSSALAAYLGSELDYSLWMERGTSRIEPRPALDPAFQKAKAKIEAALKEPIEARTGDGE